MKGKKEFESYRGVPGGSRVEAQVAGDAGEFSCDGQLVSSTAVVTWSHDDLVPGPTEEPLEANRSYFVRIRVAFLADTEATIEIRVIKPGDDVHSEPCRWKIDGKAGETAIRGCFIDTF